MDGVAGWLSSYALSLLFLWLGGGLVEKRALSPLEYGSVVGIAKGFRCISNTFNCRYEGIVDSVI